jgi:hypothetical protein
VTVADFRDIRTTINFEGRLMAKKTPSDDELVIHLDLDGLVALMKATEAAIATGRSRLELRPGSGGISAGSGSASFARVTLTFTDRAGGGLALAA